MSSEGAAAFINARHVEAKKDDQLEAYGDVELRQSGQVIKAEHLLYGQESKDVLAEGAVRLEQPGVLVTGPLLKLNLDTDIGEMSLPKYEFSENHARGTAEVMHIEGKKNYTFDDATYTTCPAGKDDWLLRMSRLDIDRTTQVGVAHQAVVEFKGVPILYTPWMDFALNSNRRSGFLAPSYGYTNKGGYELTVPYYWNIATNFDATIAPRVIAKRGTQFNNEFRYLEPNYAGIVNYEVLSGDRLSDSTRIVHGAETCPEPGRRRRSCLESQSRIRQCLFPRSVHHCDRDFHGPPVARRCADLWRGLVVNFGARTKFPDLAGASRPTGVNRRSF